MPITLPVCGAEKRQHTFRQMLLVLAIFAHAAVWAEELRLELPIESVTVHPVSAIVTHSAETSLPMGEHVLIVSGLPENLDPSRLQLSINNAAVRLGSLEINKVPTVGLSRERERVLRDELTELLDRQTVLHDTVSTAETELAILASLANPGNGINSTISGSELAELLQTIMVGSDAARTRIRTARIQLRNLEDEIREKRFQVDQIATDSRVVSEVAVSVNVDRPVSETVSLSYPVAQASWHWLYEARLATEAQQLGFLKQVVVTQNTGSDWENVRLRITTANAFARTVTPELNPLFVDLFDENAVPQRASSSGLVVDMGESNVRREGLEEIMVTGSRIAMTPAELVASQYLMDYAIPGRVSVNAANEERVLPIEELRIPVELVTRVVPDMDTSAFLETRFTYDGTVPLQAGEVQFYRDGAFIGSGAINVFLPDEDVRLPFGKDERIRVDIRNLAEESREGGFGRRSEEETRLRYEITSFHEDSVPLEVLSRLPVARNDRINVEILDGATPPDEMDVDGESGIMLWRLDLAPNSKANINHFYTIEFPRDGRLDYQ